MKSSFLFERSHCSLRISVGSKHYRKFEEMADLCPCASLTGRSPSVVQPPPMNLFRTFRAADAPRRSPLVVCRTTTKEWIDGSTMNLHSFCQRPLPSPECGLDPTTWNPAGPAPRPIDQRCVIYLNLQWTSVGFHILLEDAILPASNP